MPRRDLAEEHQLRVAIARAQLRGLLAPGALRVVQHEGDEGDQALLFRGRLRRRGFAALRAGRHADVTGERHEVTAEDQAQDHQDDEATRAHPSGTPHEATARAPTILHVRTAMSRRPTHGQLLAECEIAPIIRLGGSARERPATARAGD